MITKRPQIMATNPPKQKQKAYISVLLEKCTTIPSSKLKERKYDLSTNKANLTGSVEYTNCISAEG